MLGVGIIRLDSCVVNHPRPGWFQGSRSTPHTASPALGTTGAVPTGMRVAYEIHENFPYTPAAGGTGNAYTSPAALQIPCIAGATIAALMDGGGATNPSLISSITDSNGNTWSQIAQYVYSNDGDLTPRVTVAIRD